MIKKLKKLLFGEDIPIEDQRAKFRFDIKYVDELSILIDGHSYRFKEISLDGFSFYNESRELDSSKKVKHKAIIQLKDIKTEVSFNIMNSVDQTYGCKVVGGKEDYNKFIIHTLSPFLISFNI